MTLALLLTAVTGAWATDGVILKELTVPSEWNNDDTPLTVADLPGFKDCSSLTEDEAKALINSVPTGKFDIIYGVGASSNSFKVVDTDGANVQVGELPITHSDIFGLKDICKFYYTASDAVTVEWNASTKTGTFSMPGSDVVLTPIYAKAATFATTGTGTEATPLLAPAAAEGVIAGTDASLIAEGTGIVAFAGESTEVTQGTLMYAVGTSDTEAPALTAFSATVPTAKDVADDGATLYVWYYIQGADAPDGVAATLDNTFDDTEPACLTVQVLTNKFDIQLNAANANTIEAGKATVTVGGTDKTATVTDGKLQGVKMGSEVKLEAKPGYKFRKVEVKKKVVNTVDLSTLTADYEAVDGDELTGTLGANVKITIADGATVTLKDLTINGASGSSYPWAGLTPLGDATIVLEGTNTVNGFHDEYPGIFAAVGKTLTIKGDGSLTASSNKGTGIGGGRSKPCGNIVIEGGNITATGGKTSPSGSYSSAGIGGGYNTSCGDITITGGTITAKGGNYSAGIGSGGASKASCGNITITNTVTKVTATKGSGAANSIGKGYGSCGTVTIGGVVGAISASPYTYQPGN